MRFLKVAAAALFFWGFLLLTGLPCYGGEGLEKGETVASASFCEAPALAHAIGGIMSKSRNKTEAGQALIPFFSGPDAHCYILPAPVPIVVESVIGAGVDFEGTSFFVVEASPIPGKPALFFFFFDLPGLRKDMSL